MTLKMRQRQRFCAFPRRGERRSWTEYQVVGPHGKILSRHDFRELAEKWIEDHEDDAEWKQLMGLAQ